LCGFTSEKPDNYTRVKKQLWEKQWVVLPKNLWKSKSVVEYLGRYTHKIAISNHRIQSVNQNVTLGTRIISKRAKEKYEFNPRRIHTAVFLHILPKRFVKIRHYGFFEQYLEVKS
jgi:acyl carrier protein phosphodiesterase